MEIEITSVAQLGDHVNAHGVVTVDDQTYEYDVHTWIDHMEKLKTKSNQLKFLIGLVREAHEAVTPVALKLTGKAKIVLE